MNRTAAAGRHRGEPQERKSDERSAPPHPPRSPQAGTRGRGRRSPRRRPPSPSASGRLRPRPPIRRCPRCRGGSSARPARSVPILLMGGGMKLDPRSIPSWPRGCASAQLHRCRRLLLGRHLRTGGRELRQARRSSARIWITTKSDKHDPAGVRGHTRPEPGEARDRLRRHVLPPRLEGRELHQRRDPDHRRAPEEGRQDPPLRLLLS